MEPTVGQRIEAAQTKRANLVKLYEHAFLSKLEAGHALSEQDVADKVRLKELIEAAEQSLDELREYEGILASQAEADRDRTLATPSRPAPITEPREDRVKVKASQEWEKYGVALMAHALYKTSGSHIAAAAYADKQLNIPALSKIFATMAEHGGRMPNQLRAADPGTATSSGSTYVEPILEWPRVASMFIELFRSQTIYGRLPTMGMSFGTNGKVSIPRQTAGSTGAWVAEANAIPVKNLALDEIDLEPREQGTIMVITKRAMDHTNPSALAVMQQDMVEAAARNVDATFLDANAKTSARPAGILNGATSISPANAPDAALANIDADTKNLLAHFASNDIPMTGMRWLMDPVMALEIQFIRDGNGNRVYPSVENGTLHGIPIVTSTQCVDDQLILGAFGHVISADDYGPEVALSTEASIHREDTSPNKDIGGATSPVASMYQTNSTAIRLTQGLDWAKRRDNVVAHIDGIDWFAAASGD